MSYNMDSRAITFFLNSVTLHKFFVYKLNEY